MEKIEIKDRYDGHVIFTYECEDNTIAITICEAVKRGADLRGAYLGDAYLRDAYLRGANLGGADLDGANLGGADLDGAYLRGADLRGADLRDADLGGADLGDAYLRGAYLRGADLGDAYLRDAYLRGADLGGADLRGAYLRGADLRGADLGGADLDGADLGGADLRGADLGGADLRGADLRGAKNIPFIPIACPSHGAFVGWKKVNNCLVELEIPEEARRSSATTNKCRCDKAKVVSITSLEDGTSKTSIHNYNYAGIDYVVGEVVTPDSFDENRWDECSHGIHFFTNKEEAERY